MSKTPQIVIATAGSLVVGFAVASWIGSGQEPSAPALMQTPRDFDSGAPIEERLAALEEALSIERQAIQLLQEEVFFLNDTVDGLRTAGPPASEAAVPDAPEPRADRDSRSADGRDRSVRRIDRLVQAGFTAGQAERIVRRESELQMEAVQARYEARRAGESTRSFDRRSTQNTLRQELGDGDYERYLQASGRPTRVAISTVLEGSPALAAGLRPGDEILNYDGRRVFSMAEIGTLSLEGEAGQNVLVDITRDGIQMQVSIPRGPLGVTGGRRSRR